MNKYQEALNNIVKSACKSSGANGCQNCSIKDKCNSFAKDWVDTIQELVDESKKHNFKKGDIVIYCPKTVEGIIYKTEIGVIKQICDDNEHAFIAYGIGSTGARTSLIEVIKLNNSHVIGKLDIMSLDRGE